MNGIKLEKGDVVYAEKRFFRQCTCCKQQMYFTEPIIGIYVGMWNDYHIVTVGLIDVYCYESYPITLISKGDFK